MINLKIPLTILAHKRITILVGVLFLLSGCATAAAIYHFASKDSRPNTIAQQTTNKQASGGTSSQTSKASRPGATTPDQPPQASAPSGVSTAPSSKKAPSSSSSKPSNSSPGSSSQSGGSSGSGGSPSCTFGIPPNCVPAPPAPLASGKHWNLSFDEEFTSSTLNTAMWTSCFDWNFGDCTSTFNDGREHYEPAQVQITPGANGASGIAHLVARPLTFASSPQGCLIGSSFDCSDGACQNGTCTYASALLSTARPNAGSDSQNTPCDASYRYCFTYGFVQADIKVPSTQGFFSAFWMLPANPSAVYGSEIDILEQLGPPSTEMHMGYVYNNRNDSYTPNGNGTIAGINEDNGACTSSINYSQAFHTVAVDWEPAYIAFYIDGVKCGQFNGSSSSSSDETNGIVHVPMQIILNHMVDVQWQRDAGVGLADSSASADLQVHNIRVFQQQ